MKRLFALFLVVALPAMAQTFTCTQATAGGSFTLACTGAGAPPAPPPIVPPTPPPAPPTPPTPTSPPGTCPGYNGSIGNLGATGNVTQPEMQSGQIAVYHLPQLAQRSSLTIGIGESTATPPKSYLEAAISKCPGQIDANLPRGCYVGSYTQNWNDISWFFQLSSAYTLAAIQARGFCYAPPSEGPWYFNVRWTYPVQPAWGHGKYIFLWGNGPY